MTEYYKDGKVVYKAFNITSNLSSDVVSVPSDIEFAEMRKSIAKVYPFSKFATDAMIQLMRETNRLNAVDQCLWDINSGLDFLNDEQDPYREKVNFLNIHDLCIRPMSQHAVYNW